MEAFAFNFSTLVATKMLDEGIGHYCTECAARVIDQLDFSMLSSSTNEEQD
jgi:hypothetical protein